MTDTEIIDELNVATAQFRNFYRQILARQIEKTNAAVGYEDVEFVNAIEIVFTNADYMRSLSVEHRNALRMVYEGCKEAWIDAGGIVVSP